MTPPLTLTTQSVGNTDSGAGGRSTNLGAIAGGVIVVIVALVAVAVAVVFFIFWFVYIHIIASTKNIIIISCFVYTGGGIQQYLTNRQLYLVPKSTLLSLLLIANSLSRMI